VPDSLNDFRFTNIEDGLRSIAKEKQVGLGQVAQPLRVALCGSMISTSIFESVEMLGKEKTLARIDKALQIIETRAEI